MIERCEAEARDNLRRVHEHLSVDIGVSPSAEVPFDWNDEATWAPALEGAGRVYLTYHPDLAVPGAAAHVGALARFAVGRGVRKIVLLAGRGELARARSIQTRP